MSEHQEPSDHIFEETRDKIKGWLRDNKYTYKNPNDKHMAWSYLAFESENTGFGFGVGQGLGRPESINLSAQMMFDDYSADIQRLTVQRHRELLFKLRFRLLATGVNFLLSDTLSSATIQRVLYTEDVTRSEFWKNVEEIRRAITTVIWTLEEQFGGSQVPSAGFNPITGGTAH